MPILQVIILALVQGITEFLPISSTAHLALAPWLLGWQDAGLTFDIALHVGTLAAVLMFFFRDWLQVIAQGFGLSYGSDAQLKQNRRLLWYLAVSSIPVGVVGFDGDRRGAGAGGCSGDIEKRSDHRRGAVPRCGPSGRRAIFFSALDSR